VRMVVAQPGAAELAMLHRARRTTARTSKLTQGPKGLFEAKRGLFRHEATFLQLRVKASIGTLRLQRMPV